MSPAAQPSVWRTTFDASLASMGSMAASLFSSNWGGRGLEPTSVDMDDIGDLTLHVGRKAPYFYHVVAGRNAPIRRWPDRNFFAALGEDVVFLYRAADVIRHPRVTYHGLCLLRRCDQAPHYSRSHAYRLRMGRAVMLVARQQTMEQQGAV